MKVLMLSKSGDGLGLAQRIADEGHEVQVFIQDQRFEHAGHGFVERPKTWRPHLEGADLVVGDMVGFGYLEPTMQKMAKRYIGISQIADHVELNREAGLDVLRASEILVPDTLSFDNPREAMAYSAGLPDQGVVIKPDGNQSTAKTFLSLNPENYRFALSTYDSNQRLLVQSIVDGVEVSTEGWFNGRDWIEPFNHTFEEKRLLNGGHGPNTGCMGNVVMPANAESRLVQQGLMRLGPWLRKHSYKGPIDLNTIVNEEGVWALELTPRLGYDAIEALMESLQEPVLDLLFDTAAGIKKQMELSENPSIAVRASLKPWPHGNPSKDDKGMPVLIDGDQDLNLQHILFTDAYQDDDNAIYYAAGDGVLLKATAFGRSIDEARNRVYKTLSHIQLPDLQYRTDIGSRVERDLTKLKDWGYL